MQTKLHRTSFFVILGGGGGGGGLVQVLFRDSYYMCVAIKLH